MRFPKGYTIFILIYTVVSMAVMFIGMFTQNLPVVYTGIVMLFGGSFVLAAIGIFIMFHRSGKQADKLAIPVHNELKERLEESNSDGPEDDPPAETAAIPEDNAANSAASANNANISSKQLEEEMLENIQNSYGVGNEYARAEHEMAHAIHAYRTSSKKEKILGTLFGTLLFGLIIAAFILFIFKFTIPAIICMACFAGLIVASLIVVKTKQSRAFSMKKRSKYFTSADRKETKGTVLSCVTSSTSEVGRGRTMRIAYIVYKVKLLVDGKEYTTYSKIFYQTNETVPVVLLNNHAIIND